MSFSASQSVSKYNSLFNTKKTCAETGKIGSISSIWDDDHILRLDENNWQCLWCNTSLQEINATKSLDHVMGKKGMYIKSCYVPKDKAYIKRYQDLQQYKQAHKGVLC